MSFVITQSQKFWGAESDYTPIYKNRYNWLLTGSLEELANNFVKAYLKKTKIFLVNPIAKCHEVGLKFRR
jgi:hypothetical protein